MKSRHTQSPSTFSRARRGPGLVTLAVLGLWLGSLASAQAVDPTVQIRYDATLGHFLTGPQGMTLYIFANDEPNTSNCYDGCAENWPPLLIEAEAPTVAPLSIPGSFGVTEREGGGRQVTYNGWPLYYFVKDTAPGDTTGQGVGDVWYVANLNPVVMVSNHPELGPMLVGPTGMTLYLYTKDEEGVTNCAGGCAANWPPLMGGFAPAAGYEAMAGEGVTGELGLITREDGGQMLAYNGQPLYYWVKDEVPGDVTGQGVGDVWFVVEP